MMKNKMLLRVSLSVLSGWWFVTPAVIQAAQDTVVTAEQWELSRNGERLVQLQALQQTVNAWDNVEHHVIELQYPGGEEGELWVNELKDWLISLGVPSKYLVIVPGSGQDDIIRLRLTYGGEQFQ